MAPSHKQGGGPEVPAGRCSVYSRVGAHGGSGEGGQGPQVTGCPGTAAACTGPYQARVSCQWGSSASHPRLRWLRKSLV